jgi:hypothetical protein
MDCFGCEANAMGPRIFRATTEILMFSHFSPQDENTFEQR